MCIQLDRIALLGFERNRYRAVLERLATELNTLATEKEEDRFNRLWLMAYDALDREKLAIAAAEMGLLTDLFQGGGYAP
jgi:hypothetical protein